MTGNDGRANNGRFVKGNKISKGARPLPADFKKLAEEHSLEALQGAIDDMRNSDTDPNLRYKYRELVISYGVGKPKQQVEGDINGLLKIIIGIEDDD